MYLKIPMAVASIARLLRPWEQRIPITVAMLTLCTSMVTMAGELPTSTDRLSIIGAKDLDDLQALRFLDLNGTCIGKTFYIDDLAFVP